MYGVCIVRVLLCASQKTFSSRLSRMYSERVLSARFRCCNLAVFPAGSVRVRADYECPYPEPPESTVRVFV